VGFYSLNKSFQPHCVSGVQPLTEMSARDIPWDGKSSWCTELSKLPPLHVGCLEILGVSNSWSPKGLSNSVMGQHYIAHTGCKLKI